MASFVCGWICWQTADSAAIEPVVMATEPSVYPNSSQQLPQLPAFSDGQWFDSTIQTADLDLMSSVISPSLSLYVMLFITLRLFIVKVKVHTLDIAPLRSESPP